VHILTIRTMTCLRYAPAQAAASRSSSARVEPESSAGKGTTFRALFPRRCDNVT
jgi:hypothetical protein